MDQEQNIWETLKRIQLILINFWWLIQYDSYGKQIQELRFPSSKFIINLSFVE